MCFVGLGFDLGFSPRPASWRWCHAMSAGWGRRSYDRHVGCLFCAFMGVDSEGFFRASIVSGHVRNAAERFTLLSFSSHA
jgi:hypothetical protein